MAPRYGTPVAHQQARKEVTVELTGWPLSEARQQSGQHASAEVPSILSVGIPCTRRQRGHEWRIRHKNLPIKPFQNVIEIFILGSDKVTRWYRIVVRRGLLGVPTPRTAATPYNASRVTVGSPQVPQDLFARSHRAAIRSIRGRHQPNARGYTQKPSTHASAALHIQARCFCLAFGPRIGFPFSTPMPRQEATRSPRPLTSSPPQQFSEADLPVLAVLVCQSPQVLDGPRWEGRNASGERRQGNPPYKGVPVIPPRPGRRKRVQEGPKKRQSVQVQRKHPVHER